MKWNRKLVYKCGLRFSVRAALLAGRARRRPCRCNANCLRQPTLSLSLPEIFSLVPTLQIESLITDGNEDNSIVAKKFNEHSVGPSV